MTDIEFKETLDLMSGKRVSGPLFTELKIWVKAAMGVEVYHYFCDTTTNGLLRLRLVLWDFAAERNMHDGPNLDAKKQMAIAKKFSELARFYQIHQDYWQAENIFVCYETLRDEIQKDILKRVRAEIKNIQHPDIWRIEIFFESIHVFYKTDEQIVSNQTNGISDYIRNQCTQLVKRYDWYNAFANGANCIFSSHQTIDEKFHGNMFYYYNG
ncbi:MAG: hypothetical protein II994_04445 [Lachnospiraceae bacterium]|nr:hypothetical protein [Lachnospiraceae bacterium]